MSMPNVDSAMTTDAGPQLFSDCQTCFISPNAADAGADFGSGAGAAATTGSNAVGTTAGFAAVISGATVVVSSTSGAEARMPGVESDGAAANAAPLSASTTPVPSVRSVAGRRRIGGNGSPWPPLGRL